MEDHFIEGCKKRDRKSFEMLYNKYAPSLLGVCYRYSKSMAEAEDVLHEGFIKVFNNIDSFKGKGSFEGWLKRIMVNTSINNYKASIKHYFHEEIDEKIIGTNEIEEPFQLTEGISQEKLLSLIKELPKGYQLVFNMYVLDGLTHNEIAEELNISVNTSKTQLFKARRTLRDKLSTLLNNR